MRSSQVAQIGPKSNDKCPQNKRENGGRDWSDAATGRPGDSSSRRKGAPLEPPGEAWPCWHLVLIVPASRTIKE